MLLVREKEDTGRRDTMAAAGPHMRETSRAQGGARLAERNGQ